MNRLTLIVAGLALFVAAYVIPYFVYVSNPYAALSQLAAPELNPTQVSRVADHVSRIYLEEVDRKKLMRDALRGMTEHLDPYSTYIDPVEKVHFDDLTNGDFGGIGVELGERGGRMVVLTVYENGPAGRAGMLERDIFTEVDGVAVDSLENIEALVRLVRGPKGSSVHIKVYRPSLGDEVDLNITRDTVEIPSVVAKMMEGGILYVQLKTFHGHTDEQLKEVLEEHAKELKGLVIDLRSNGGGLLIKVVNILGYFLPKDSVVVRVNGRRDEEVHTTQQDGHWKNLPLAVLINGESASASEIMAGALQDHKRAAIWGQTSFGKGLVQDLFRLEGGEASLKLTVARYLTPNGHNLQREGDRRGGVSPDEGREMETVYYPNVLYQSQLKEAWDTLDIPMDFDAFLKKHPPQRQEPDFPDPLVKAAHQELLEQFK